MSHEWLNLPGAELLPAPPDDPLLGWLFESDLPPGEPTSADDPPLESDPTPPTFHPAGPYAAGPTCPEIRIYRSHPPECGGLRSDVAERARAYQLATLRDPYEDWENAAGQDSVRAMRRPSAMTVFRLIAHFAHPEESRDEGHDRVGLLHRVLNSDDGIPRSSMQQWKETSDFMANGLIRLLGLFAHESWAPDANDPNTTELVIPCELQWQIVRQLLGWKYWGDEPARHPEAPAHDEVYWSENHQILFATAEYLAGQFLPTHTFLPIVHYQAGGSWQTQTDGAWRMSADDRMAHAYPRLVRWLDHRLMFGFSEWTSPVYAEYDLAALANLVDFCDAPEIVTKASMVLDILLLELSRFAGHGRGVGTAGRAYSVHKWTGWDNSVCDTLQILYGRWPVEPRQEQVLEEWRLQNAVAIKAEDRAGAEETYRKEADDQELDDQAAAAYVGQKLGQWDLDNPGPFRRVPPFGTDWNAADSPGAHSLASLRQYCIPEVVMWFSDNQQPPRFERSRVSIDFGEGERNYGIGFQQPMDLIDWWSRGGFATPETIVGSRDLADAWDVEDATPFGDIPGMTVKVPAVGTWLMPDAVAVTAADKLSVESYGSCLTTANLALWREGDVSLSSAQKFRVNQLGRQAHIWQASLGPYITIWSTYPAAESAERGTDGPTWWSGNAGQPRVVQRDDALICVHDSSLFSYTHLAYGIRSHAWFPVPMFDEALEVRRPDEDDDDNVRIIDLHSGATRQEPFGLNANRGGTWWFGRWKDAYVGLFSAKDSTELLRTGRWADRELLCEDRINVFICQVGTKQRFGSFHDFVYKTTTARIYIGQGVYQPSNPFVDIYAGYDPPFGKRLGVNLEDRWPSWDGTPFSDEQFCRWETPWSRVLWRKNAYSLDFPNGAGGYATLSHDLTNNLRTGTGV